MLGTFGTGGVVIVIIVALIMHKRGGGKLKPVKDHHVFYWGAALGIVAAGAGQAFQQLGGVSTTISNSLTSQSATVGAVGPAAVAAVVILIAFGSKPHFGKDLVLGVAAPGILSAATGVWALPVTIAGAFLHTLVA